MRIALMLDTSDAAAPALTHMRAAAPDVPRRAAAGGRGDPHHDRAVRRASACRRPPTAEKLKEAAAGLFTDGAGTVLMDGLLEIDDRFFKKTDDRWPVLVIFTSDGTESSTGAREKEFMKWSPLLARAASRSMRS